MAGLMLKFPSGDRIVLNGAVVENAGRGARLRILTPDTQLLRLRDAIDPSATGTPVGRVAHGIQMMLVGEVEGDSLVPELIKALRDLRNAFVDERDRAGIDAVSDALNGGHFYQALRRIGPLRAREAELLGRALS